MAVVNENENADPVGTPVSDAVRKAGRSLVGAPVPADAAADPPPKPRDLHQQQQDFTAEGSPPPGHVGRTGPVAPAGASQAEDPAGA